jgi:hypothetical protein
LKFKIGGKFEDVGTFTVLSGKVSEVILGMPLLRRHNPIIDWTTGDIGLDTCVGLEETASGEETRRRKEN